MPDAHLFWRIADAACRGMAVVFNAYGAEMRAEPVARDYRSHWGFFPTLHGQVVPHSVPVFVEKATGSVLPYGDVPCGTYQDYVGVEPRIGWSEAVPIVAASA